MEKRRCLACDQKFKPRPQVPKQAYCVSSVCQRERRRQWQKSKRSSDPDYRENQQNAQRAWNARNADYWRKYRKAHPEYRERNRVQQRVRNRARRRPGVAKMDESTPTNSLSPGIYRITPAPANGIAKMNSWNVEITLITDAADTLCGRCKERTS